MNLSFYEVFRMFVNLEIEKVGATLLLMDGKQHS